MAVAEKTNQTPEELEALKAKAKELVDAGDFLAAAKIYQADLHSPEEANPLYVKAAEAGVVKAFNPAAIAFKNGQGVEKDLAKAEEMIAKGMNEGDFVSAYNYATWLQNGDLGRVDEGAALEAYKKALECEGYGRAPAKVKERIRDSIALLGGGLSASAPVAKKKDDGKAWILGFYGVLIVLGIAGCILTAFAAKQLNNNGWYGLYALFGTMIASNVVALAWKKLRYNSIHFYSDLVLALGYIIAIVICAVVWYKAKGL